VINNEEKIDPGQSDLGLVNLSHSVHVAISIASGLGWQIFCNFLFASKLF
jgi:hypothetical protein